MVSGTALTLNMLSSPILFFGIVLLSVLASATYLDSKTLDSPAGPNEQIAENTKAPLAGRVVRFSGEIGKGRRFEKEIGENLFFRLIPVGLGWTISVGSKRNPEHNFCAVATPPYRGVNHIYIEGWQFRNSDNTGPNEVGPKNVNAPQEVREFNCVLSEADYQKAFDALQKLLWSYTYSKEQVNEAERIHERLSKGSGTLTIRDLKLNNLGVGKQADIDVMIFEVDLNFPK
ncbi:MAG TPA: hypothetical protein VFU31_10055 [Candidatus Binatia bacterium]|nr:hypothetical protein [Candidatus Binatia bacterium]